MFILFVVRLVWSTKEEMKGVRLDLERLWTWGNVGQRKETIQRSLNAIVDGSVGV
jgi:hypothetical protein